MQMKKLKNKLSLWRKKKQDKPPEPSIPIDEQEEFEIRRSFADRGRWNVQIQTGHSKITKQRKSQESFNDWVNRQRIIRQQQRRSVGNQSVAPEGRRPVSGDIESQALEASSRAAIRTQRPSKHLIPTGHPVKIGHQLLRPELLPDDYKQEPIDQRKSKSISKIRKLVSDLFTTGDLTAKLDREAYMTAALKDLLIFLIFLIITTIAAAQTLDPCTYEFKRSVTKIILKSLFNTTSHLLISYEQIRTIDQIWTFLNAVILESIYAYNPVSNNKQEQLLENNYSVLFENILIGPPRLRQLRVKNDSCQIDEEKKYTFKTCYASYSSSSEDQQPFGVGRGPPWTYTKAEVSGDLTWIGELSTYKGGGYHVDFPSSGFDAGIVFFDLFHNTWIDRGTRVVFLDLILYSETDNAYCVVKLIMELPATGGVVPRFLISVVKLAKYFRKEEYVYLALEIASCAFILFYTVEEILEIKTMKKYYFTSLRNIPDFCIILFGLGSIVAEILSHFYFKNLENRLIEHIPSKHISFDGAVSYTRACEVARGLLILSIWLKLLKFANLFQAGNFITNIYSNAKKGLFTLTIMIIFMIFGFSVLGNALFGTHVKEFSTISDSFYNLIFLTGGGQAFYEKCKLFAPFLTYFYFGFYIFIIILLLLPWYPAIFYKGILLTQQKEAMEDVFERFFICDMWRNFLLRLYIFLKLNNKINELRRQEAQLRDINSYDFVTNLLKRNGFKRLDRILFFRRHQLLPSTDISLDKMDEIIADVNGMNKLYAEVQDHEMLAGEVYRMKHRLDELTHSIVDMTTKMDILIDKMSFEEHQRIV